MDFAEIRIRPLQGIVFLGYARVLQLLDALHVSIHLHLK